MPLPLPVRFLYITAVALVLADVDWAAKAWALDQLRPDQLVLNTDRPWHAVVTPPLLAVILVACARTRLLALGAGVIVGGALGNMGASSRSSAASRTSSRSACPTAARRGRRPTSSS